MSNKIISDLSKNIPFKFPFSKISMDGSSHYPLLESSQHLSESIHVSSNTLTNIQIMLSHKRRVISLYVSHLLFQFNLSFDAGLTS